MILKISKQHIITKLSDFEHAFNARPWLDNHFHLYENSPDIKTLINEILVDYFADYKGTVSIIIAGDSWIITEYMINFVVIYNKLIIPCNSKEQAERKFSELARKALKSNPVYQMYPQDKIDYSVLQNMVTSQSINLQIIGQ